MPRYVAFLRGINLGNRRVKSDALRRCVAELGFEDVAVFRASGNVILTGTGGAAGIARTLEAGLEQGLGYPVAVFLRSAAQVRAIAAHEPFERADVEASAGQVQVALLTKKPTAAACEKAIGALLGTGTMRTQGTIELIAAKHCAVG